MAIRKIIYANDKRLRQQAQMITTFSLALKQLADDMLETMKSHDGVGMAAPQIGVPQRLFVAEIPPFRDGKDKPPHPQSGQTYILINPHITKRAEKLVEGREGCLSIPSWFGEVERAEWVEVEAQDLNGKSFCLRVDNLLGRVFQHEIDHLNGILFPDHIVAPDKLWQELPESNDL
jgi:peptide deformylase